MLRRKLPLSQVFIAAVVGVISGVYIFGPCFEGKKLQPSIPQSSAADDVKKT